MVGVRRYGRVTMLDQVASGGIGLIVGAVIGLIIAVLFEDLLRKMRDNALGQLRRLVTRGALPATREEFRLGELQTSLIILEGDGENLINEQTTRIIVEPTDVTLPKELDLWRQEVEHEQAARKGAGQDFHWNGPIYAVSGFAVSRCGVDESPEICLRLKGADYFTFLATQQLDRYFEDGTTPRSRYIEPYAPTETPDFMSASFGVYVAVVTADNLVVFSKRSQKVGAFPGLWDASANEALSRSLDSQGRTPPNLYDVARRGLAEELCIDSTEYRLELLAFDIDRRTNQWGCMFAAFMHGLTGNELADRRSRGVPDKWEHDRQDYERFEVSTVMRYLLRDDRRDFWTPVAPALFYFALVRKYGRSRVERDAARTIRKLSKQRGRH